MSSSSQTLLGNCTLPMDEWNGNVLAESTYENYVSEKNQLTTGLSKKKKRSEKGVLKLNEHTVHQLTPGIVSPKKQSTNTIPGYF